MEVIILAELLSKFQELNDEEKYLFLQGLTPVVIDLFKREPDKMKQMVEEMMPLYSQVMAEMMPFWMEMMQSQLKNGNVMMEMLKMMSKMK